MAVSDSYREFVLEQLGRVRPVTARKMFGGVGLYADGAFFALLDNDTLFFKVDDTTRPEFVAEGMKPFQPFGEGTQPMNGYYEVPADVLERNERLAEWMARAVAVAVRAAGDRKTRPKAAAKRRPETGARKASGGVSRRTAAGGAGRRGSR